MGEPVLRFLDVARSYFAANSQALCISAGYIGAEPVDRDFMYFSAHLCIDFLAHSSTAG